ncbi:MAG TPA: hypothetical protein VJL29_05925 [Thermoguttaceae bacterium]|nr:hypothetical protein [Thermoguttaceae bacterium]
MSEKVRKRILDATRLLAYGMTWKQVAERLGTRTNRLFDCRQNHRDFWNLCFSEAKKSTAEALKQVAGTPEIFANGGKLIRVAEEAAKEQGIPLVRPSSRSGGKITITAFLEQVYLPSRISVSESYASRLRSTVRMLVAFLGKNIAVDELNEADLCRFLTAFFRSRRGRTVNGARQTILTIWRNAYDNNLCERLPRLGLVRRVPEDVDPPEAWTSEQCNRLFSTAARWEGMVGDIPAGPWWLSLLLSIYWTGCRIGAMIQTPADCYRSGEGLLVRKQKNHRPQWYSLPASCCEAIDATRPNEREMLWPWSQHRRTIWIRFRQIVEAAGIPSPRTSRQLFHRLRRTTLSLCAAIDPAIAQRQAGHADYATTLKHYVDPRIARGRGAADVLPEPVIALGQS